MTAYRMALDQGTTSSRCIIFDREGNIVAKAAREFPQHFPKSGWVEHDAEDILHTQLSAARDALNGWDPTGGCLYYYNPATATSKWIWSREVRLNIGDHSFAV